MDLVTGWNSFWSALSGGSASLNIILAALGAAIVVFAVISWVISKRRGGGVSGFPWMMVILGVIFAAPTLAIPVVLGILQIIINVVLKIANAFI